jgi:hypothetical protein
VSKQAAKEAKMKVKERAAILHEASKCFLWCYARRSLTLDASNIRYFPDDSNSHCGQSADPRNR